MSSTALSERDFEHLQSYIHKLSGIFIPKEKAYLIMQRLEAVLEDTGTRGYADLYDRLMACPNADLHDRIIAAITTNETSFFRDGHPFDAFKNHILPVLAAKIRKTKSGPQPKVRIWSAAASTGQEPYSLAILVREFAMAHAFLGIAQDDFAILATDISSKVLERAGRGAFNDVEIARGLSDEQRQKYFLRNDKHWVIKPELRAMVEYRRMNLVEPQNLMASFDVVFCRNVLIYFDDATKKRIIDHMHRKLTPDGFLVLGSAENLYNLTDKFKSELLDGTILYRRKDA